MICLHPYTAGKPNISDSCFCVYCTRTAIIFSRKEASMSFFFGIFNVNYNKTRTGNTAHCQSNNPYCYQQYTPGKSAFSDPIFLVFCQLCRTYISLYNGSANKTSALVCQYLEKQAASHGACAKDTKSDFSIACIEPKQPYFAYDN